MNECSCVFDFPRHTDYCSFSKSFDLAPGTN